MSNIDRVTFEKVINECPVEVESNTLEHVISLINDKYAAAMSKDGVADFKSIRNEMLDYCDLWDLLLIGPYKTAIGKYYNLKRQQEIKNGYQPGEVYGASADFALLAASKNVKILFRAIKSTGKLDFKSIDTGRERFARKGKSTRVSEEQYLKAKRQALAIMNSRRK